MLKRLLPIRIEPIRRSRSCIRALTLAARLLPESSSAWIFERFAAVSAVSDPEKTAEKTMKITISTMTKISRTPMGFYVSL